MMPLVSIITPCYNGANYLNRFFDSLLQQTYSNIEVIIVNDGSIDETEEIVSGYQKALLHKGYSFKYIKQENAGPAAAINAGLRVFTGDYLTWVDCDDWMTPDCIKEKVDFLEKNPQVGLAVCKIAVVSDENVNAVLNILEVKKSEDNNFFERLLNEEIYIAPPIGWMIRTQMFLQVNPAKRIFDGNKAGQNWQMLLPISYHFQGDYIDKVLGYYLIRKTSISHSGNIDSLISKSYEYETNCKEALKSLSLNDEERYLKMITERYTRARLNMACKYGRKDKLFVEYDRLKSLAKIKFADRVCYLRCKNKLFGILVDVLELCPRLIRKIKREYLKSHNTIKR